MITFSGNQKDAIEKIDNNVIVSASAGSGKTTVMIERIKRLILDKKVNVKNLLVVTFVNAAAADIKEKLRNAIIEEYEKSKDEFLYETLNDLPLANISTLHSFCNDLVKMYFYKLGVMPRYKIAEEDEISILRERALTNVLDEYYENADEDSIEFIFKQNRSDEAFKECILKIYNFLGSKVDIEDFLDNIVLKAYNEDSKVEEIVENFNYIICKDIFDYLDMLQSYKIEYEKKGLDKHVNFILEMIALLKNIKTDNTIQDNLEIISKISFSSIPRLPKESSLDMIELHDSFKNLKSNLNDKIKSINSKYDFDKDEDFKSLITSNQKNISLISDILKRYHEEFSLLKREENVLDFSDLEKLTIKLLQDEDVRQELKNKYDYIFVDEYQDINPVQEYILKSVSNGKNMFMVGDVKQSIYGFRLCSPEIFLYKYNDYRKEQDHGYAIDLNQNFRSEKKILDFNNVVFSRIMTKELGGVDYLNTSMFQNGRNIKKLNTLPTTTILNILPPEKEEIIIDKVYSLREDAGKKKKNKAEFEARAIEKYISDIVGKERIPDDNNKEGRLVEYGDIAILVRDMQEYSTSLFKALANLGLPIVAEIEENTGMEVLTLIDALKIIDNIKQDIPLISVMRSCIGEFTDEELAEIKIFATNNNKYRDSFYECVSFYAINKQDNLSNKIQEFLGKFDKYNKMASFMTVSEIVAKVVSDSKFDIYVQSLKNSAARMSKVNNFMINISKSSHQDDLSEYLDSIAKDEENLKNAGANATSQNAIKFMTIHKSKGLEFPIVIFAHANKEIRKGGATSLEYNISDKYGIGLEVYDFKNKVKKPSPIYEVIDYENKLESIFEEIRILYVCLTRAKNHLLITALDSKEPKFVPQKFNLAPIKTYMQLILAGVNKLTDRQKENLSIEVASINVEDLIKEESKKEEDLDMVEVDNEKVNLLKEKISKKYPYLNSTVIDEKYSVTEINNINKENEENKEISKQMFINQEDAIYEGVLYHTIFQNIDFECKNELEVKQELNRMVEAEIITEEDLLNIEVDKILKALTSNFITSLKGYDIYREIPFMLREQGLKYGIETEDFVIIQGQIDLLAITKDKVIVVDFKNSKVYDEEVLRERYKNQLMVYADAVSNIFKEKAIEKYIFSLKESKEIKV